MGEDEPAEAGDETTPGQQNTKSVWERPVIAHTVQVNTGAVLDGPIDAEDSTCNPPDCAPTEDSTA